MPAIQTAAAAVVRRGFDTICRPIIWPPTPFIYHFTVEQYLHRYSLTDLPQSAALQSLFDRSL